MTKMNAPDTVSENNDILDPGYFDGKTFYLETKHQVQVGTVTTITNIGPLTEAQVSGSFFATIRVNQSLTSESFDGIFIDGVFYQRRDDVPTADLQVIKSIFPAIFR